MIACKPWKKRKRGSALASFCLCAPADAAASQFPQHRHVGVAAKDAHILLSVSRAAAARKAGRHPPRGWRRFTPARAAAARMAGRQHLPPVAALYSCARCRRSYRGSAAPPLVAALDPLPCRPSDNARNFAFSWHQHHAEPSACTASGSDRVRRGLQPPPQPPLLPPPQSPPLPTAADAATAAALPQSASHAATAMDGKSFGHLETYAREGHSGGRHVYMVATPPHERTQ